MCRDGVEVELEAADGVVQVPPARHQRVNLPEPADAFPLDQHGGAAARMQERLARRLHAEGHTQRLQQRGKRALGGEEVGLSRVGVAPGRRPARSDQQRAEVIGLAR